MRNYWGEYKKAFEYYASVEDQVYGEPSTSKEERELQEEMLNRMADELHLIRLLITYIESYYKICKGADIVVLQHY